MKWNEGSWIRNYGGGLVARWSGPGCGFFLLSRLSATAARIRSFKAASSILSSSWMSMARRTFPSRLELKRPEGSFNEAPLAKVSFTTLLYVSPVQTIPPWEKTGVPIHFHSSTISGSALLMISRTFASVLPRQSPSSLIFASISAEADSASGFFHGLIQISHLIFAALGVCWKKHEEGPGTLVSRRDHRRGWIADREVGDERGDECDGEAGVGPLLEARGDDG